MVRGIGVAVITSTWGLRPSRAFNRRLSRCSTPNRCCSSTTTNPRLKNSTVSWIIAWVPMMMSASPETISNKACRLSAVRIDPVKRTTLTPSGTEFPMEAACWEASTSVGANRAACVPASTACSIAQVATMVLPEPTSPCNKRIMGSGRARSSSISLMTRRCPSVRSKGRWLSSSSR